MIHRASDELMEALDWTNLSNLTKEIRERDLCGLWTAKKKAREEVINEIQYGEPYYLDSVADVAYFVLWLEESRQWASSGG